MKSYAWIGYGALGLSSAAFLNLAPVWADDAPQAAPAKPVPAAVAATPVQAKPAQAQAFDLQMHTRLLLESLQRKLNLTPDQQAAWETWAAAERQSAVQRQQQWQQRAEARAKVPHGYTELSTPERMAQAIAHLRDRQQQLQQALLQLEERQLRTQAFYDKLNADQKTIFDLYLQSNHGGFGALGRRGDWGDAPTPRATRH